MNSREHYAQCLKSEKPTFVRVLRAVPPDRCTYRPHEKSTCAGDLAWLLAAELHDACELVDHHEVNYVPRLSTSPSPLMSATRASSKSGWRSSTTTPGGERRGSL